MALNFSLEMILLYVSYSKKKKYKTQQKAKPFINLVKMNKDKDESGREKNKR